jgi:hypothetical protein
MVFGELGQNPIDIQAKCRMLNFWQKIASNDNSSQLSSVMYRYMLQLYEFGIYKSAFLSHVKSTLDNLGLGFFLRDQLTISPASHFKSDEKKRLQDQFVQSWQAEINENELYYNYRMFKQNFEFEKYLLSLPENMSLAVIKFRTLNHKLPIQKGRFLGVPRTERLCQKCLSHELGDEFHYLFCLSVFS